MDTQAQRKAIHQLVSFVLALVAARLALWLVDKIMGDQSH
jgi:hypothetical protein